MKIRSDYLNLILAGNTIRVLNHRLFILRKFESRLQSNFSK